MLGNIGSEFVLFASFASHRSTLWEKRFEDGEILHPRMEPLEPQESSIWYFFSAGHKLFVYVVTSRRVLALTRFAGERVGAAQLLFQVPA